MTRLRKQLSEDRAIRNTAKALMLANVEHLRGLFVVNTDSSKFTAKVTEEARDLADEAGKIASEHKGALAFLLAAIALWFSRDQIFSLINGSDKDPKTANDRTETNEEAGADSTGPELEEAT